MDKLKELENRLKELEKKKNNQKYPTLGNTFQGIGGNFSKSIPHIVIGGSKPQPTQQNSPIATNNPNYPYSSSFTQKETNFFNKLYKYGLIITIGLVIIYAAWRILFG